MLDWPPSRDLLQVTIGLPSVARDGPVRGDCTLCPAVCVSVVWLGPIKLPDRTVPLMACQPCTEWLYDRAHDHPCD